MPSAADRRFLADGMVGRLAKWLRFAGVDAVFHRDMPDAELKRIALHERRVLLTRDRALADALPADLRLFVRYQKLRDQLKQVMDAYPGVVDPARFFSRCVKCNASVQPVERGAVQDAVPSRVFELQREFWRCPVCRSVYWRGSHTDAAVRILAEIRDTPQSGRDRF